jgi:hypothetical protein
MTLKPFTRVKSKLTRIRENQKFKKISDKVIEVVGNSATGPPILFFNASTRLEQISQNAAFSILSAWSLALDGHRVRFFTCDAGMTRCLLGTNPDNPGQKPPCDKCFTQSRMIFPSPWMTPFTYFRDEELENELKHLGLAELLKIEKQNLPLGEIILPSLRWILRRQNLEDQEPTRAICREYIRSANSLAIAFSRVLKEQRPAVVVVFNGQFYPEAIVKLLGRQHGIRVISHEVALQPLSAFFTEGEATAYPIHIPEGVSLTENQNRRLDEVLEKRFQGDFSMAGIKFWSGMKPIDVTFWKKAEAFHQIVPIFTNVIFDTSQSHANSIYTDMFSWLGDVASLIKENPQTLFVIRAHPDENRPGKESRETVSDWVKSRGLERLPNVVLVEPGDNFSSYQLIQRSKFVMVYNSTIGLEASILGAAVLCAGKARFTQVRSVFLPTSREDHLHTAQKFLNDEKLAVPTEFRDNARYFLYFQLFRTSLPFGEFLEDSDSWKGYVKLKDFPLEALKAQNSHSMSIIQKGILEGSDFIYPD